MIKTQVFYLDRFQLNNARICMGIDGKKKNTVSNQFSNDQLFYFLIDIE